MFRFPLKFCFTFFLLFQCAFSASASSPTLPSVPSVPLPNMPSLYTCEALLPLPRQVPKDIGAQAVPDLKAEKTKEKNKVSPKVAVTVADASRLSWPVMGKVTSGFGKRGKRRHEGIDIPVPHGTPVQASSAGTVKQAKAINGYGKTVIIDHGNGVKTLYAHCSAFAVSEGEQVQQGQVVAFAGRTGRATTSHVHFGVMHAGKFEDPIDILKAPPAKLARR